MLVNESATLAGGAFCLPSSRTNRTQDGTAVAACRSNRAGGTRLHRHPRFVAV